MILAGYQETNPIYAGSRTRVYQAIRNCDGQSVIIKVLRNPHPNFQELIRFRNQYVITRHLEHPAIVQPLALERCSNGYALVMPNDGAIALSHYWRQSPREQREFLNIAIPITEALHYLIQQRIIHKDIKPANILVHPETKQVKLIDFSISSLLPREQKQLTNPNILEGTLAYISPEQTGRMNRGIDYRTDFYSLGATFFELLTGKLPFESNDPMEIIHCHIARGVEFPARGEQGTVPEMFQGIILKLMAKNAEDRYQSALGLRYDLERCRQQWEATGKINPFKLGERDLCDRFLIPEKLYGREVQVQTLLDAFTRVADGTTEMMLVAGFSGIGKTAVVNEVHKPIVKQRGYFIKGKFDQFNRNIPFSAFVQAFRDLMGQLLGESDAELNRWQEKILAAVGENGQVIINVIPELESIVGKQPPVPELSGSAAQNRFNLLFSKFVRVFATQEHPLVIFLDDLQWVDSASLNLLKLLMDESEAGYLLVLGAYRDNEVFPAHPLMLSLTELEKTQAVISSITLEPLEIHHINQLIAQTLSCSLELAQPLTELVNGKTRGNPFFTTQFLQGLYEDKLITFNYNLGYWECDLVRVRDAALTDDVVQFMAGRLQKLPEVTQEVLKLAACIGNQFDLETLAVACEDSQEEVATNIWGALQEGLLLPISEAYKFFQGGVEEAATQNVTVGYRFLHDRVQQAAYALIDSHRKQATHWQIGQRLLQTTPESDLKEYVFKITNQLNAGLELAQTKSDRERLVHLNLMAAQKAKAATAYVAALDYCNIGRSLLPDNSWNLDYSLTLSLYRETIEAAYLNLKLDSVESLVEEVLEKANTLLDKIKVYEIQIQNAIGNNQLLSALDTGFKVLEMLGVTLINPDEVEIELPQLENLEEFPEMTDPYKLSALEIFVSMFSAIYNGKPSLLKPTIWTMVHLCTTYGHTSVSPVAYSVYGMSMCGSGNIDEGYQSGSIAFKLLDVLDAKNVKCKILEQLGGFVSHWKEHVKATIEQFDLGLQSGLDVGDIEYACHAAKNACAHLVLLGEPLDRVQQKQLQYIELGEKLKQQHILYFATIWRQLALTLMGESSSPCLLSGDSFDELEMLPILKEKNNYFSLYVVHFSKQMLCYLFGETAQAMSLTDEIEEYSQASLGSLMSVVQNFYTSLIFLNQLREGDWSQTSQTRDELLERIAYNQECMKQWAQYAPMNHLHKYQLVEAERYSLLNESFMAIDLYDRAIAGAKENEYLQEEALANELAAKFYLNWGKEKVAAGYMQEAYYCYARWGAKAKSDHLEQTYPQLLAPILNQSQGETLTQMTTGTISSTSKETSETLDLATVIKASQALSEEIEFDALLSKLMYIVMENGGADRAALILNSSGSWEIVVQCHNSQCYISTIALDKVENLPKSIINKVKRSQENLLVNNLEQDKTFAADAYLSQHQPKSLFCTPILKQGKFIGILYLENNLAAEAFTQERIVLLQTLATQAAISLENAQLYDACKRFVPDQFISFLEKNSIVDVKLGDQVEREMTVLFSDIRDFTTISEKMTPAENFAFINEYLGYMEPQIQKHGGFIDKYIGDAIMALFANSADEAVKGALAMLEELKKYNSYRQEKELAPLRIGIGLHTGRLMLGTVGGMGRMDGTAIGDSVNLSSRVEGLTKNYGVSLLITHKTLARLNNPLEYDLRFIDQVKAKGKAKAVALFEVFSADPPELKEAKIITKEKFEKAVLLYYRRSFLEAAHLFKDCLEYHSGDRAARSYLERCNRHH